MLRTHLHKLGHNLRGKLEPLGIIGGLSVLHNHIDKHKTLCGGGGGNRSVGFGCKGTSVMVW